MSANLKLLSEMILECKDWISYKRDGLPFTYSTTYMLDEFLVYTGHDNISTVESMLKDYIEQYDHLLRKEELC